MEDKIIGSFESAYSYFHLNPKVKIKKLKKNNWIINLSNNKKVLFTVLFGETLVIRSKYSKSFGNVVNTRCFKVKFIHNKTQVRISWIK